MNTDTTTTPLPVAKWTRKSLLKILDRTYMHFLISILNNAENMTKEELNKRLDFGLKQFQGIYNPILDQGVKAKPL